MKIPPDALIAAEKITHYLLVQRPWDDKSRFLAQAGFHKENPEALIGALRELAAGVDAIDDGTNEYGEFLRTDGEILGPNGPSVGGNRDIVSPAPRQTSAVRDAQAQKRETSMKMPLYERVALSRDLDEHGLKKGDVAVLVDHVPHPEGGEEGCLLEVFNALGESIAVIAVRASDVEPMNADEVLAVRHFAQAG
ncbi:MAG TPA: DUF4926 domain-containing protein [Thermoanaerobaculia bacterium]|nr:DUF4926 domain-containing protein [Thermoanaerobaculia bacterium]